MLHQTISYPFFNDLPVWILKTELETSTGICFSDQRLICQGKELRNDDRLTFDLAHSTIHVTGRLRGGDLFKDIGKAIEKPFKKFGKDLENTIMGPIKDFFLMIWEELKKIGRYFECAGNKIANLWYCFFFYYFHFIFWLLTMSIYSFGWIVDKCIGDDIVLPLLKEIKNIVTEFFTVIIEEVFPALKPGIQIYKGCFVC